MCTCKKNDKYQVWCVYVCVDVLCLKFDGVACTLQCDAHCKFMRAASAEYCSSGIRSQSLFTHSRKQEFTLRDEKWSQSSTRDMFRTIETNKSLQFEKNARLRFSIEYKEIFIGKFACIKLIDHCRPGLGCTIVMSECASSGGLQPAKTTRQLCIEKYNHTNRSLQIKKQKQ